MSRDLIASGVESEWTEAEWALVADFFGDDDEDEHGRRTRDGWSAIVYDDEPDPATRAAVLADGTPPPPPASADAPMVLVEPPRPTVRAYEPMSPTAAGATAPRRAHARVARLMTDPSRCWIVQDWFTTRFKGGCFMCNATGRNAVVAMTGRANKMTDVEIWRCRTCELMYRVRLERTEYGEQRARAKAAAQRERRRARRLAGLRDAPRDRLHEPAGVRRSVTGVAGLQLLEPRPPMCPSRKTLAALPKPSTRLVISESDVEDDRHNLDDLVPDSEAEEEEDASGSDRAMSPSPSPR